MSIGNTHIHRTIPKYTRMVKNNKYDLLYCSKSQKKLYEDTKKKKIEKINKNNNITQKRKDIEIRH